MRIAIDYTAGVQQRAGIGRFTRELIRALSQLDSLHSYTLYVSGREGLAAEQIGWPANFRFRAAPIPERYMTILWHRFKAPLPVNLWTGRADIFHSPDFALPPVWGAKTLVTIHDLSFMRVPQYALPSVREYLLSAVPDAVRRADGILADSESTRQDAIELLSLPPERVRVVPGGVSPHFKPVTDTQRLSAVQERYHLERPFVFSLSRLEPRKNIPGLIRAFRLMVHDTGLPHLLAIGGTKGWMYEPIFEAAAESGLGDRIRFLGFVDDTDLPALYSLADVFAYPSFYEGIGLPVLEALACGAPVVTANNSSLPEAAGDAALLVDAADTTALAEAMARLIQDEGLRMSFKAKGTRHAAQFTWERAASVLLQAYEELGRGAW